MRKININETKKGIRMKKIVIICRQRRKVKAKSMEMRVKLKLDANSLGISNKIPVRQRNHSTCDHSRSRRIDWGVFLSRTFVLDLSSGS